MRRNFSIHIVIGGLIALLMGTAARGWSQSKSSGGDKPANNMEIVHEKLKADKKLIVSKYMELTE